MNPQAAGMALALDMAMAPPMTLAMALRPTLVETASVCGCAKVPALRHPGCRLRQAEYTVKNPGECNGIDEKEGQQPKVCHKCLKRRYF